MNQVINYFSSVCDPLESIKLHSGAHLGMMASESVPQALIRWKLLDKMLPFVPVVLIVVNTA